MSFEIIIYDLNQEKCQNQKQTKFNLTYFKIHAFNEINICSWKNNDSYCDTYYPVRDH